MQNLHTISPTIITILSFLLFSLTLPNDSYSSRRQKSSELPIDHNFQPKLGTYYYDVFLKNIKIGKGTISVQKEGDIYTISVTGKTNSSITALYKIRYRGMSELKVSPLQPIKAKITQQSGKKKKETQISFTENNVVHSREIRSTKEITTKIRDKIVHSETFVLDPFSTVFLIRRLNWHVGMEETFDLFTGKKQYELKLICQSTQLVKIGGISRQAWVIIPEITSYKKGVKKTRNSFKIYLSLDKEKEILKISGTPKPGSVIAKLRKFSPISPEKQ